MLPWFISIILTAIIIALIIKITAMQKSMNEIRICMREHLSSDTNNLIYVSSNDKYVKMLAAEIARELKTLRRQRLKYVNGDRELKEAVTNISHDLRTPLTAISGYLELLENEERSENVSRYLSSIAERTEAMKALTEELFRYSVITSVSELNYERLDVRSVLEDSLLSFCGAFEQRGIEPEILLPESGVWLELDKSALSRIFSNIISNAVKYGKNDFKAVLCENSTVIFSNTAPELSNVDVGKLFDRFFTVDSARKSTGLGLSIAKLLTERMGGAIEAEFRENKLYITVRFDS